MMVSPSVSADMPPMKEKFHKIMKIPSEAATDFAKRFGFYDHAGCDFRLPREDDTFEGPAKDGGLPFHTVDFSQGGVRVPLDPVFCSFLKRVGLLPTQCAPTLFEIFNGFRNLGTKVLGGVWLDLDDLRHYYRLAKRGGSYTLESRTPGNFLVTHIPESHHGTKPYIVYLTGSFESGDKCPRVAGFPDCKRVLPWCETPPHKYLLDRVLQDSDVNRSIAYLLGYTQPNSRVRQTGSTRSSLYKKAPVYRNTTDEASEESISDSSSEFDPNFEMSNANEDPVAAKINENAKKYRARMDSNKLRAKKISNAGGKGKAVVGSSRTVSPCLTDDVLTAPVPKSTPVKSKVYRTPSFFDVDRCARWKPSSDIDEETRAELEKLPRLPKPRKSQDFGVIGTGPTYAQEVLASYMSFDRDVVKLESESSAQNFGAMLQNSAEMMARLSFASHAMVEKEVTLEKRLAESETEVGLLRVAASKFDARQADLVDRAAAEYIKGVKEGELSGWNEAVLSFKEAGHLDQAAIDSVVCHLNMSEGEEENMEMDNTAGAQGNVAPINEMFF